MLVAGATVDGPGRLWAIAGAHTAAQLLAMVWLAHQLRPTVGGLVSTVQARALGVAVTVGVGAWLLERAVQPDGRLSTLAFVALVAGVALALYGLGLRALRALPPRAPAPHLPAVLS
jgi:hypothetical protein